MISRPRMGLAFILADARNPQATASHGATDLAPPGEMAPHCEVHKTEPSALVRREAASALPALTLNRQDGSTYPLAALTEAALVAMRENQPRHPHHPLSRDDNHLRPGASRPRRRRRAHPEGGADWTRLEHKGGGAARQPHLALSQP